MSWKSCRPETVEEESRIAMPPIVFRLLDLVLREISGYEIG